MFVEAAVPVPLPFPAAHKGLDAVLAAGGLVPESRRAADEAAAFLMRVGPFGHGALAKQVRVQILPARVAHEHVVVPLRWQATGAAYRLFPSLDADLNLHAAGPGSVLSIVASYRPPLEALGAGLDRALMSRVAKRTLDSLLADISTRLVASHDHIDTDGQKRSLRLP